ncbi:MAG: alpha/beta fold hydrolase [Pseudanabaenaceae cyanobacterium bins.68]|nr:alpha/beta fold hydrolase [Pseudanabaenaceae cyanobacterium bins.68]
MPTFFDWQGHQIHYVQAGHNPDRPPLLLIHGFGASTDHWRKNIEVLGQTYQVWAIDLLGFGRSAKPALSYSGQLWQAQIHDFIQQKIGRPAVLAGNSLGGYAALCVAGNHPESCAGLILLNSAGAFTDTSPLGSQPLHPLQVAFRNFAQAFFQQPWGSRLIFEFVRQKSQIRQTLKKVYVNQDQVTERLVAEIYRPSTDPGAAQVFAAIFANPQGEKVDQLLAKISAPIYCIWGEQDPWINAQARSAKFHQYAQNFQELFIRAGHCPHDDAPELVNQAIAAWLESRTKVST